MPHNAPHVKLTPGMRDTLEQTRRETLRRTHDNDTPGRPPWPAPWQTIHALERRGLITHNRRRSRKGTPIDEWTITDLGRQALNPPPRTRRATTERLRVPGGTTRLMQAGEWAEVRIPEPEPMNPGEHWTQHSRQRHLEAQDRRQRARRLTKGMAA